MTGHMYRSVAIVAGYNTKQARQLPGVDSFDLRLEAALGVLEAAGVEIDELDAVLGSESSLELIYSLGIGPARGAQNFDRPIPSILDAANAIAVGAMSCVLIVDGNAGSYTDTSATAPWTRPDNEFVVPYGLYTAAEFALMARRHMELYGTTPEQLAHVAATIRNHGHVNPEAVYFGRGPYTVDDILSSRMVADPFHLLDCSSTTEGGAALLLTTAERAKSLRNRPVFILGGSADHFAPAYHLPPSWDFGTRRSGAQLNGYVGARAAQAAFAMCGLGPSDVDCCELYDPFSFEVIRQFEAFGFCGEGEGGPFVIESVGPNGNIPLTTDGGTMSFSHSGRVQMLQRVIRGVQQIQGSCRSEQLQDPNVVLCSAGGSGAFFNDVMLLGSEQP